MVLEEHVVSALERATKGTFAGLYVISTIAPDASQIRAGGSSGGTVPIKIGISVDLRRRLNSYHTCFQTFFILGIVPLHPAVVASEAARRSKLKETTGEASSRAGDLSGQALRWFEGLVRDEIVAAASANSSRITRARPAGAEWYSIHTQIPREAIEKLFTRRKTRKDVLAKFNPPVWFRDTVLSGGDPNKYGTMPDAATRTLYLSDFNASDGSVAFGRASLKDRSKYVVRRNFAVAPDAARRLLFDGGKGGPVEGKGKEEEDDGDGDGDGDYSSSSLLIG